MAHGLDTHYRTRAQLTAITGGARAAAAPDPAVAQVVTLPTASPWAPRDGAKRLLVAAAMDGQNRIAITKLAAYLGWADGTDLIVRVEPGRARVWAGVSATPVELASQYRGGRITLPAAARARLDIGEGDVVVATASVDGELLLAAAADVAQALTGAITPVPAVLPEPLPAGKRGGVKPAWRAPVALGGGAQRVGIDSAAKARTVRLAPGGPVHLSKGIDHEHHTHLG